MLWEVQELSMAQEDGALPAALSAESAPGESAAPVLSARFIRAIHIAGLSGGATSSLTAGEPQESSRPSHPLLPNEVRSAPPCGRNEH
jgi:hypothetical protein